MKNIYTYTLFALGGITLLLLITACGANTPDAVFNRGARAYSQGDTISASLQFEKFIEQFPEDERILTAYQALARCFMDMKDYTNMRAVFVEMKEKFPDPNIQLTCDFQIGNSYFYEGFFDKAIKAYSTIADSTTNHRIRIQAFRNIAGIYARQTQAATAHQYFNKIIRIAESDIQDPTEVLDVKWMALTGRAEVYKASAEFDKARELYKQTLNLVANATEITGIDTDRQKAVMNWALTWREAGDYITSVTLYDKLQNHPYIKDELKPQLIALKIEDLQALFRNNHLAELEKMDEEKKKQQKADSASTGYSPEETALLVNEYQRLVDDYPENDYGIHARVSIAQLIRDTTPEEAKKYFDDAINMYEKLIANPPDPQRPLIALFQMTDAYIRYDQLEKAKQTLERIRQSYSQVPQAMQRRMQLLQYIEGLERKRAQEKQKPVPAK